jgi:hypothetical protein
VLFLVVQDDTLQNGRSITDASGSQTLDLTFRAGLSGFLQAQMEAKRIGIRSVIPLFWWRR